MELLDSVRSSDRNPLIKVGPHVCCALFVRAPARVCVCVCVGGGGKGGGGAGSLEDAQEYIFVLKWVDPYLLILIVLLWQCQYVQYIICLANSVTA
jgi:hypothetical protein